MHQINCEKPIVWRWRIVVLVLVALIIISGLLLVARLSRDAPVTYENPEEHFKYGSSGGERESGIPYWIWKVLPKMFPEYLPGENYVPGQEYASLGFLYEPGKDLPIGVSKRNTQGIDRVFLNCADLPCRHGAGDSTKPAHDLHRACRRTRSISKASSASSLPARRTHASTPTG